MHQSKKNEYTLNTWLLTFKSKRKENQFRRRYYSKSIKPFRTAFITVTLMYSAFGYFDFLVAQDYISYFFIIRYLVVLPILSGVLLFSFNRAFRKYWQGLLSFSFIIAGSGIIHMLIEIPENMFYYGGLFLVFMAGYFFIKLRYLYASISGLSVLLIYNLGILFFASDIANTNYLLIGNGFYLSANLIGILASYHIELLERKDFMLNKQLTEREGRIKKTNKKLEERVQDRTKSLKEQNIQLEQEIQNRKELENYLLKTKKKAEESDKLKTAFLNNISHEFHTPMNGILGFSTLITESCDCEKQAKDYGKYLKQSCKRLLSIVTDTVEISKVHSGNVRLIERPNNFTKMLLELTDYAQKQAESKGLKFEKTNNCYTGSKKDIIFMFDQEKITRLFRHIVDNALKFTSEGYVRIHCEKTNEHTVKVTVTDSGIGISQEMQKRIFEPFRQTENLISKNMGGSGVGLSLAKAYTEMSGGKISLKSEPGSGSEVTVVLPVKYREGEKNKLKIKGKPATVLIVDDNKKTGKQTQKMIEEIGLETQYADKGEEAIEICRSLREIDMLIIKPELEGISGYETAKLIKQFRSEIAVIAATDKLLNEDKAKLFKNFFDDYISLPLNDQKFFLLAEKYL